MAEHTEPNRDTLAEEQVESGARHGAPQRPTADQARAAESATGDVDDDDVRTHYQDMAEKGARVKGEGQIP
ncbi:MAG: hypothetical protein M0T71_09250 [Actinomycetota bacterium]|nr:hypothetical protein [Actinomycetota bacterium]